jgi:hypothetical protein
VAEQLPRADNHIGIDHVGDQLYIGHVGALSIQAEDCMVDRPGQLGRALGRGSTAQPNSEQHRWSLDQNNQS